MRPVSIVSICSQATTDHSMQLITSSGKKIKYATFCEEHGGVPVFLHPWWLDLDAGADNWDVVLAETNGQIIAALPHCFTKLKFFKGIGMPPVAPYQGYFVAFPPDLEKAASKIAWEQKLVQLLFGGLPAHTFFYQHFSPEITNWIPLYWLGYRQTTKYSHVIEDLSRPHDIFDGFEQRARSVVRKAEKKLTVAEVNDSRQLIELVKLTYQKQNLLPPYDLGRLARLTETAVSKKAGKIYLATDESGNAHAAAFVVWDQGKVFYTIQASNPAFLADGGAALIVWHAIRDASAHGLTSLDFTGSMMPNVEKYLRSFGAVPVQRHYITKENSFLFYWLTRVKEFLERRKKLTPEA